MLLLLHQTYRKGNHLVNESDTVKYVRNLTYLCATLSLAWSGTGVPSNDSQGDTPSRLSETERAFRASRQTAKA
jgi:hypothetical protein